MKTFEIHVRLGQHIATFDVVLNESNGLQITYRSGLPIEDNFISAFSGKYDNCKIYLFEEDVRFSLFVYEIKWQIKINLKRLLNK